MKTSIPEEQYQRLRSEIAIAKERFGVIGEIINENYGDRSDQASRVEQIVHAMMRLERELTRYEDAPESSRAAG